MFCTACPAAPFPKLSIAAITTARSAGIVMHADIAKIRVSNGAQIGPATGRV